jgi:hypothetical protein
MKELAIHCSVQLGLYIVYFAIPDKHYDKVVYFDNVNTSNKFQGYSILGNVESLLNRYFDELIIEMCCKQLSFSKKYFDKFPIVFPFSIILNSSLWLEPPANVNQGYIIYPSCPIDSKAKIGATSILNFSCSAAHDSEVGNHSFLSPRESLTGFINIGEFLI